jgi:nucleotide-binding universal stress UspA family protein
MHQACAAGIAFKTDYVQNNHPWQAIIDAARRHGCDAIFMGSHGRRGLSRLVYGSQTVDVLTHSDIPTLVYR